MPAQTAALCCHHLSFQYPDGHPVLHDLSFSLAPGKRVALIGPNGAGKTTLFGLCTGILTPSTGQIQIYAQPLQPGRFYPDIGFIFQQAEDQLFCPSVAEDVAFGPQNMGLPAAEVQTRVADALATVGAEALAERPVHHLSGGEKRLVTLAGILAMQPRLLLLDEPSAGLDIRNRRRLIHLLQSLDLTLLIASHDLEFLLELCTRVLLLDQGRCVADGPIVDIMSNAPLMQAHGQEKPHSLVPHLMHTHR